MVENRLICTANEELIHDNKNNIWLPIHPASLFQPLNNKRIEVYIHRWLERRNFKSGWLIYEIDSHWNERIIVSAKKLPHVRGFPCFIDACNLGIDVLLLISSSIRHFLSARKVCKAGFV